MVKAEFNFVINIKVFLEIKINLRTNLHIDIQKIILVNNINKKISQHPAVIVYFWTIFLIISIPKGFLKHRTPAVLSI